MNLPVSPVATPAHALDVLLAQLAALVGGLPADVYSLRFAAPHSGSIGEHVRHCLDHVSALLTADGDGTLSYDHRERGTDVETDPVVAVLRIHQLQDALDSWTARSLDEPVRVAGLLSTDGNTVVGWSTLARELAFVVSHTIHHQAMMGLLLATCGYAVPTRFGHAPSTPYRH